MTNIKNDLSCFKTNNERLKCLVSVSAFVAVSRVGNNY